MKLFFIIFFAVTTSFALKRKLSPYQVQINECVGEKFPVAKIDTNKKMYAALAENFPLKGSETTYREVVYKEAGELRKLRYEAGIVRIFKVEEDESLRKLSTEELGYKPAGTEARYKAQTPEARLNELLAKAEIKSDYSKTIEYRAKQVLLNIIWTENQIKSITADLPGGKKLECLRKQDADICDCH